MRIYIAGPMTGIKSFNFPEFRIVKNNLLLQGYDVISPVDLDEQEYPNHDFESGTLPSNWNYKTQLEVDIMNLKLCDAIFLLKGWENSNGAKIELCNALQLDLMVMLQ